MKTIKQLADELGVSKQAVHQKRKSKELSTILQQFTTIVDGIVYISVDGEKHLKQSFLKNTKHKLSSIDGVNENQTIDTLIAMLQRELDAKNAEIERLHKLIEKEQQLRLEGQAPKWIFPKFWQRKKEEE